MCLPIVHNPSYSTILVCLNHLIVIVAQWQRGRDRAALCPCNGLKPLPFAFLKVSETAGGPVCLTDGFREAVARRAVEDKFDRRVQIGFMPDRNKHGFYPVTGAQHDAKFFTLMDERAGCAPMAVWFLKVADQFGFAAANGRSFQP